MNQIATATKQPAGETRPQRADARRNHERLLVAARAQFARHGLDAQIDEIACEAGVGVGTVYRHFPTKEDLLQALADHRFEGLAAAARAALEVEDPWEGFERFMTYSARVMAEDRGISEAMDQRPANCGQAAERAGLPEAVSAVVERAQAAGELRADIVPTDIPSLICGLGRTVRADHGAPSMSWERHLGIILAGLRA